MESNMENARTGYSQYCPITRALEVLGERWSLLIVRDMLTGSTRFNDLARGLPGLSRSLLSKRLRYFEDVGLVYRSGKQYLLTEAGRALQPVVFGLGEWGAEWMFDEPRPEELDAELLVWWMHTRLDTSEWPGDRQVVHITFSDDERLFWIVIESGDPSVCLSDPGYHVDVTIRSDVGSLYQVWVGRIALKEALRSGRIELIGPTSLRRRMADTLQLSPIAPTVAAARRPPEP